MLVLFLKDVDNPILCNKVIKVNWGIVNITKNRVTENDSETSASRLKKDNKIEEIIFKSQVRLKTQFNVSLKWIVI